MGVGDKEYVTTSVTTWVIRQIYYLTDENDNYIVDENGNWIISGYFDGFLTYNVPEPTDGNTPGLVGLRSYRCVICGFDYKEDKITMFRGKPYGVPCGCSKDIRSILIKEREDRRRGRQSDYNIRHR